MESLNNLLSEKMQSAFPIWQAPLPFDLISVSVSGRISAAGAVGTIRIADFHQAKDIENMANQYQKFHHRLNFSIAQFIPENSKNNQENLLQQLNCIYKLQPHSIGFMHGLPAREIIQEIKNRNILTYVYCSNAVEALAADIYGVDFIVLQGDEAGGERVGYNNHLNISRSNSISLLQQCRGLINKPLILWGDFSKGIDVLSALLQGASAIMLERQFLACKECELPEKERQKVIEYSETYSEITSQFTRASLRVLKNNIRKSEAKSNFGIERLWQQFLLQEEKLLPVSLSPIHDPENIENLLASYRNEIKSYLNV